MYATGSYFTTLGVGAFTGRVFTADDDHAAAPPVAMLAYHAWQGLYGGDTSIVGSTLVIEGHAFTVAGITPPGFFGETLRADPPDLWLPLQHEPLITGADTSLLRQPVSAWLRVIGRLRPEATTDGMDARLTALLRQWMRTEAGYPVELDAGNRAQTARTGDHCRAGRRWCRLDEGAVRAQPADPAGGVRAGAAHRVRQRGQPAAGARGGPARPDGGAAGPRRVARTDRRPKRSWKASCWPSVERVVGLSSPWAPLDCCCRWPLPAPRCCPSTSRPHRWCSPLPPVSRC